VSSAIALVYAHNGFTSSLCHVSGTAVVTVNGQKGKDVEREWKNTRKSTTTSKKSSDGNSPSCLLGRKEKSKIVRVQRKD